MKNNTKIYNRFKGFTLEDCDCRYCLYYGGRRKGKVNCLADANASVPRKSVRQRNAIAEKGATNVLSNL